MKIFYQNGIPGYGARFYISFNDSNSKAKELLKLMCAWGDVDKWDTKENWFSYEMPTTKDYSVFKTVIEACCSNTEILENLPGWEEFLMYCKIGE